MSLFISVENQKLLWNIIQKVNLFHTTIPQQEQQIWFKQNIGSIYEIYKNIPLKRNDLENLNKEALQYMLKQLKNRNTDISPYFGNGNTGSPQNEKPNPFIEPSKSVRIEPRSDSYNREFIDRQKEYENMMKKEQPVLDIMNDKIEDTAIENMDELLQQHLKQRELDIMPFQNNQPLPISEITQKPSPEMHIKNNVTNSKVSWRFSEKEHHEFSELKQIIAGLKEQMENFKKKVEYLEKETEVLKSIINFKNNIEMEVTENETHEETI